MASESDASAASSPQNELSKLEKQFEDELKNDARFQEYFSGFSSITVSLFLSRYARKKAWYLTYGESNLQWDERDNAAKIQAADNLFWSIRQLHLFEMQCLWRAEQITLPGVECCADFMLLSQHIRKVEFLPPVTQQDIELMSEFLQNSDEEFDYDNVWFYEWYNYEDIKELAEEDDWGNPWYEFYFQRLGKTYLLQLPDVRGEKEEYYLSLEREHRLTNPPSEYIPDTRPELDWASSGVIENYIRKFESPQLLQYFFACEKFSMRYEDDLLDSALEDLRNAEEIIPIDYNEDWREAIKKAARRYKNRLLVDALQQYYFDYLNRIEAGISLLTPDEDKNGFSSDQYVKTIKKMIREGRRLNGEPPDLNF
jgi:hypothetical protein